MVKPKDYKFYLVHFTREKGVFDIAYREWIHYDRKKEIFFCKYHAGNDGTLAQKLMKDFKPAPKEWKSYPVEIRGGADTWDLALDGLERLNDDPYAFSTSDEGFVQQQIEELKKKLKFKRIDYHNDEINAMFSQLEGSLNEVESDNGKSSAFEISPNEKGKENDVRKRRLCLKRKKTLKVSSSDSSLDAYQERRSTKKKKFSDHSRTVNSEICDERTVSTKKILSYSDTQQESAHYSKKPQQRSQPSPSSTTNKTGSYDELSESLSSKQRKDSEKLSLRRKELFSATPFGRPLQSRNRPIPMTFPRSKSSLDFSDHVTTSRRNSDQSVDVCKYLRNLTSALGQVQGLLVKVHEGQQEIKELLADPRNVRGEFQPIVTLKDYYCEDINKFQQFNTKLEEERDFREKICIAMVSQLNSKYSLTKNIGYMLKPLIPKEVLLNYVSRKKTKDKSIFSELPIWRCITEAFQREAKTNKIAAYKEANLIQALGGTINNCRSWGKENKTGDGPQGLDPEDATEDAGQ